MLALIERPLCDLLAALDSRSVSAQSLCEAMLERIQNDDGCIAALSDVLAEQARAAARQVDARRAAGQPVGTLAGVPVVVKDLIDVAGATCCAGLEMFSDYRPDTDAWIVRRLREEDAVIVGMGKTDSGAFGVVTPSVTNPRDPGKIVGGSSGGSAAAVAAGWCGFAIGTDTGGSVRIPAVCCGISGFKPSKGLISTEGVRPLAPSFDHVGFLYRHAIDLPLIMEALMGYSFSSLKLPEKIRLGCPWTFFQDADAAVLKDFEKIIALLRENGCEVVEVNLPDAYHALHTHLAVSLTEAARDYTKKFAEFGGEIPFAIASSLDYAENITGYAYLSAVDALNKIAQSIESAVTSVDCMLLPTLACAIPHVPMQDKALPLLVKNTALFNYSGFPALSLVLPLYGTKIPPSIQLVGQRNGDAKLVQIAKTINDIISSVGRSKEYPYGHANHT